MPMHRTMPDAQQIGRFAICMKPNARLLPMAAPLGWTPGCGKRDLLHKQISMVRRMDCRVYFSRSISQPVPLAGEMYGSAKNFNEAVIASSPVIVVFVLALSQGKCACLRAPGTCEQWILWMCPRIAGRTK
jgi:hypothetical protein